MIKVFTPILLFSLLLSHSFGQSTFVKNNNKIYEKAINFFDKGNNDKSLELLKEIVKTIEKNENIQTDYLDSLLIIGVYSLSARCYFGKLEFEPAINNFEKLLMYQKSLYGDCHKYVYETYYALGSCFEAVDNNDNALDNYLTAYGCIKDDSLSFLNSISLIEIIADLYMLRYDYLTASKYYDLLIDLYKSLNVVDDKGFAELYLTIGYFFEAESEYAIAFNYYNKALIVYQTKNDTNNVELATVYNCLGTISILLNHYTEALEYFFKEIEINTKINGEADESASDCYFNIGLVYSTLGNHVESNIYLFKSLNYGVPTSYQETTEFYYSNIYYYISSNYYYLKDYENSRDFIKKRIDNVTEEDAEGKVLTFGDSYSILGNVQWELGMHKKAIESLETSIEYYTKSDLFTKQLVNTYIALGEFLVELDSVHHAIASLKKGIAILEQYDDIKFSKRIAELKSHIGYIYFNLGDYEQAQKYYDKALIIFDNGSIDDSSSLVALYSDIGLLRFNMDNVGESLYYQNLALQIGQQYFESDSELKSSVYTNKGIIEYGLKHFSQAEFYFLNALEGSRIDEENLYLNYAQLGNVYRALGEFEKSRIYYDSALNVVGELNTPLAFEYYFNLMIDLGKLYLNNGDYQLAENYYKESLKIAQQQSITNSYRLAQAYSGLGRLNQITGNLEKAVFFFEKSIDLLKNEKMLNGFLQISIYEYLFSIHYTKDNHDEAYECITKCIDIIKHRTFESILHLPNAVKEENIYNLYSPISFYLLMASSKDHNNTKDAYDKYLQFKKIILNSETYVHDIIRESQDIEQNTLYSQLQKDRLKLIKLFNLSLDANSFQSEFDSLSSAIDYNEQILINSNIGYKKFIQSFYNITDSIRGSLSSTEACLDYININPYGAGTYYYIVLLRNNIKDPIKIALFEESKIISIISEFKEDPTDLQIIKMYQPLKNGKELYKLLISPAKSYLDGIETLFISSSGLINNISLSVLPMNNDSILSDKYKIHYVSSLSDITSKPLKSINIDDLNSCVFFSEINYDKGVKTYDTTYNESYFAGGNCNTDSWDFLPGFTKIDRTLDSLRFYFSEIQSFSGVNATKEAFLEMDGNSPDLIHLYTHGFYCEGFTSKQNKENLLMDFNSSAFNTFKHSSNPLFRTGLIMAGGNKGWKDGTGDGILTAYEILQLDLSNTELVILAACVTGLGDIDPSEGVYGLQRAFKVAGVDKLMVSLWPVKDFHTKQFFDIFYANLRNKQSIKESFYNAQDSMRSRYENRPDLWGGFILLE